MLAAGPLRTRGVRQLTCPKDRAAHCCCSLWQFLLPRPQWCRAACCSVRQGWCRLQQAGDLVQHARRVVCQLDAQQGQQAQHGPAAQPRACAAGAPPSASAPQEPPAALLHTARKCAALTAGRRRGRRAARAAHCAAAAPAPRCYPRPPAAPGAAAAPAASAAGGPAPHAGGGARRSAGAPAPPPGVEGWARQTCWPQQGNCGTAGRGSTDARQAMQHQRAHRLRRRDWGALPRRRAVGRWAGRVLPSGDAVAAAMWV